MQRVQISAATDRWMMGDRYGTIIAHRKRKGVAQVRIQFDQSGKLLWFPESLIGTYY